MKLYQSPQNILFTRAFDRAVEIYGALDFKKFFRTLRTRSSDTPYLCSDATTVLIRKNAPGFDRNRGRQSQENLDVEAELHRIPARSNLWFRNAHRHVLPCQTGTTYRYSGVSDGAQQLCRSAQISGLSKWRSS